MVACVGSAAKSVRLACGVTIIIGAAFSAVLNGQSAPTVSLTSPSNGSVISGTVTATAVAVPGIAGVQFMLDNSPLGPETTVAPYAVNWNTRGSTDLIVGVAKVVVGPMTIGAGTGFTKRLRVSCPGCSGDDTVSVDRIQSAPGAADAAFTLSGPAHYAAHMAAFKAAATPRFLQGATATSNTGSATIAKAFTTPIASHSLIVAAVAWSGSAPLAVTDNRHNVYAAATTTYDPVLKQSVAIVYAANAAAGATTVTARFATSSPAARRLEVLEYAGIATTKPLDTTSTNMAAGTTTPGSVISGWAATTVTLPAANGSHTLTAVARDAAGNRTTSAPVTITVANDPAPPAVSITAPAAGTTLAGTAVISAAATAEIGVAGVQFRLDGAALGAEDTTAPYSTSWNTVTAANGSHTLTAIARDAAGNHTTSAGLVVTVSNDTTPPVMSSVVASSILASGVTLTWTTDEPSDSQVDVGLTGAYGSTTALNTTLVTTHSVTLSALIDGTLYHLRARSRDGAGNLAVSGDVTATTLDATPPSVSITAPGIGSTASGTISVTASAADNVGVAGVQFQLDGAPLGAEATAAPFAITWNTAGQLPGLHALTAVARDAAGNRTTSAIVPVTVANTSQVTLAWDASLDPTLTGYKVYVGTASGLYTVSVVDVGNVTTYTINGLQPGTVYYIAVTAYDDSGNEGGFSNEISTGVP